MLTRNHDFAQTLVTKLEPKVQTRKLYSVVVMTILWTFGTGQICVKGEFWVDKFITDTLTLK